LWAIGKVKIMSTMQAVRIPMRDGIKLAATLCLPAETRTGTPGGRSVPGQTRDKEMHG